MAGPSRRSFLTGGAAVAAGGALASALPGVSASAASPDSRPKPGPQKHRTGTIRDVEHVVVLMQENRSFDHYYGALGGVAGFGDKTTLRYPDGTSIFAQPDAKRTDGGRLLPWHMDTARFNAQEAGDLDHSWQGTHAAWNKGAWNGWVPAKGEETMGYFTRADIPWQYALADAFTICDHYFCSIQGPTTPNRLFHWTGMIDPAGTKGGPAISNPDDYLPVYDWTTYPERLEKAGVDWRVYANDEVGDGDDGYVGDYGDNPLWLFHAYHDALASTDRATRRLAERASLRTEWKPDSGQGRDVDHVLAEFIGDCRTGSLPTVSWVVAPYAYSEHPQARPVDGANYTQRVLTALWDNPSLWEKTVVLINFDENDGFFDHVPAPFPAVGTRAEYVQGLPVGLGPRVPMMVVSPWSRGGWVDSQVFDHTSVLRFLEVFTGVREPNISDWRREVCGDLTSCLDFTSFDPTIPNLPDTATLVQIADGESDLPKVTPPAPGTQVQPKPEYASRRQRALPYRPDADLVVDRRRGTASIRATNGGTVAIPLTVWDRTASTFAGAPLLVAAKSSAAWSGPSGVTRYDAQALGPDGFLRDFTGTIDRAGGPEVSTRIDGGPAPAFVLTLHNSGRHDLVFTVTPHDRGGAPTSERVRAGRHVQVVVAARLHRYDVTVETDGLTHRYAGRIE